ncbi:YtxH domain-containing protein [Phycicoccus sp. CSK15P-2]|uniref:YtxH domain-containing protein n=1 Tax=Phycicoccus sp. CSK15P-2 TaxID=2807627 RepID=UPI0019515C61|nr:YtxH domain-containing protein [Phycicoccus sp. CSK15P-2]MBM6405882.1 YtxH domain-containing protein [Phycicoccus sp. CSK15P-2]
MSKLTLLAAAAVGYVLGARAGRERYEEIADTARSIWSNPRVQKGVDRTQQTALQKGREAGRKVGEKASEVGARASEAVERHRGDGADDATPEVPPTDGVTAAGPAGTPGKHRSS